MKAWFEQYSYLKNLGASLCLHAILFAFLLLSVETGFDANRLPNKAGEIVQAVVVDEQQVAEEVTRLEHQKTQEKIQDESQQKQQAFMLNKAKQAREQEQAKLEQLKRDIAKAKHEEQERLSEIMLAKEKEKKELEQLKRVKEKEKNQLAALEDQRQAEQKREKEMQQHRDQEKKKLAELETQKLEVQRKAEEGKREAKRKAEDGKRAALQAAKEKADQAMEARQGFITSEAARVHGIWGKKIENSRRYALELPSSLSCRVSVTVLPDGSVQVRLLQSSGSPVYDDLAIKGVYKAQPFELPEDQDVREQLKVIEYTLFNTGGVG